jgi:hypothetical protein
MLMVPDKEHPGRVIFCGKYNLGMLTSTRVPSSYFLECLEMCQVQCTSSLSYIRDLEDVEGS